MWTTARIRRHIQKLDTAPFSTRIFLNYGSRPAVDQAIWRLVKKGEIIRVARGLFIKAEAPYPSSMEIARAKAEAFGRIILKHNSGQEQFQNMGENIVFASTGSTTSFQTADAVIELKGESPRKMSLDNGPVAGIIRSLWRRGKYDCNQELIREMRSSLNRIERRTLKSSFSKMPGWLSKRFL